MVDFFKRRNRRARREGTINARAGRGEYVTRVDFHAKEVDASFADASNSHASCQPPQPDELKVIILSANGRESVVKISWATSHARRVRFVILG